MAYSELVKNFSRIRDYMREFYVYGFKNRDEYIQKSARSYDDERRRLESWLGEHMQFRQTADGKNVFLSIDSRSSRHNPLYKAWKTKSFTDGDITLHFILLDIFAKSKEALPISEITGQLDAYLSSFSKPRLFDESTVRKKLKEYVGEGIIVTEKRGKASYYKMAEDVRYYDKDVLHFFSEAAPCGVIGSFLLDREREREQRDYLSFKHHYITSAMDSEILFQLFEAMHEKRSVLLKTVNRQKNHVAENHVVPLQIFISVQSGRQYLMAYKRRMRRIASIRIDNIVSVEMGEASDGFEELREKLEHMKPNMWGVSTQSRTGRRMESVEFIVHYSTKEQYIHHRLEREKRCGTVEKIDEHTSRFSAEVYDVSEMIPWIRSFICRITEIHFSNSDVEAQFQNDLEEMYRLYGLEGGEQK